MCFKELIESLSIICHFSKSLRISAENVIHHIQIQPHPARFRAQPENMSVWNNCAARPAIQESHRKSDKCHYLRKMSMTFMVNIYCYFSKVVDVHYDFTEIHVRNLLQYYFKIPLWNSYGNFSDVYSKISHKISQIFL